MHPGFQCHPAARHLAEYLFSLLSEWSAASVPSSTAPASSRTQYQLDQSPTSKPTVSLGPSTFPILRDAAVLIFFIAGLLYLLRFERVDNLGAYSIPPETGLLIPSVYDSKSEIARR
jgi:hypothetical protein